MIARSIGTDRNTTRCYFLVYLRSNVHDQRRTDNQLFDCTISCAFFLAKTFPILYICREPAVVAVSNILTFLVMTRCWAKIQQTHYSPNNE